MSKKHFSNQTAEQVIAHLKSSLGAGEESLFNITIDGFAKVAEVRKAVSGPKVDSKKREKIRGEMQSAPQSKRKKMLSAKRREKPKLKHVRNGRMVSLKGYSGY
jgi:hypothetical protein